MVAMLKPLYWHKPLINQPLIFHRLKLPTISKQKLNLPIQTYQVDSVSDTNHPNGQIDCKMGKYILFEVESVVQWSLIVNSQKTAARLPTPLMAQDNLNFSQNFSGKKKVRVWQMLFLMGRHNPKFSYRLFFEQRLGLEKDLIKVQALFRWFFLSGQLAAISTEYCCGPRVICIGT